MNFTSNQYEYENILLMASMQDEQKFYQIKSKGITESVFEIPENAQIWNKLEKVAISSGISPLSVTEEFGYSSSEARDTLRARLEGLASTPFNPVDIEVSIKKLKDHQSKKALIGLSQMIGQEVNSGQPVEEILAKITNELFSINTDNDNVQEFNALEAMNETSKDMKKRMDGEVADGVSTGIQTLDDEIRCFYYGLATIVIGRPGHGKTTLMINTFVKNIQNGDTPVFISLEMPAVHVVLKMLSIWTRIKMNKLFDPKLLNEEEKNRLREAILELSQKKFYIVDAVSMPITDLGMILLKYVKLGCKVAYLDYIQLVKMANGAIPNTAAEFRAVFKEFREILRMVNRYGTMASVIGAQAGRSVESRPIEERIPQMSDLEWSSSLEQDAAVIIGIMNRQKYEGEDCEYKNQVFLGFPKHRYENAVRVNLAFLGDIQLMADLADNERYENVPENWRRQVEREDAEREQARIQDESASWNAEQIYNLLEGLLESKPDLDENFLRMQYPQLYNAINRVFGNFEVAMVEYLKYAVV